MTHGVHPLVKLLFSSRVVNIHPGFGVHVLGGYLEKLFFRLPFLCFSWRLLKAGNTSVPTKQLHLEF